MVKIETLAVHGATVPDSSTGSVAPPIVLSTNFKRATDGGFPQGFVYSRLDNPNRAAFEHALSLLEGGRETCAFSSGSAATLAVLQLLSPGDHVVFPLEAYYGTSRIVREVVQPWGIEAAFCDTTDLNQLQSALRPNTKLIWVETPSNPTLKISDISAIGRVARGVGALFVCDNTWATPVLTRPLELGADMVVHSSSKYLGGHGDVTGGAVVVGDTSTAQLHARRLRVLQTVGGAIPSPFDCWLLHRGLRTLPLRVRAQSENAMQIARFLTTHASVEAVHYPGLVSHSGNDIAATQMSLFGGMLSFQVRGTREEALKVAARTRIFTRATSLGSIESLIEHRASMENYTTSTPENLLRVSVGLENTGDLVQDLMQALDD